MTTGFTLEWGIRIRREDGTTTDRWMAEDQARALGSSPFADVIIRYISDPLVVPMVYDRV